MDAVVVVDCCFFRKMQEANGSVLMVSVHINSGSGRFRFIYIPLRTVRSNSLGNVAKANRK